MNTICIQWRARFLKLLEELDNAPSYNTLKLHIATGAAMCNKARASELDFRITSISNSELDQLEEPTDFTQIYICEFRKPMSGPKTKIRVLYILFQRSPGLAPMITLHPDGKIINREGIIKYVTANIGGTKEQYPNTFSRITNSRLISSTISLYINN